MLAWLFSSPWKEASSKLCCISVSERIVRKMFNSHENKFVLPKTGLKWVLKNCLKKTRLETAIKCNSVKNGYEVTIRYLGLPLYSFVFKYKTKPGENVKFIKSEMFLDTSQQKTAKHAVTFLVSRSRRVTRGVQFSFCPY